MSNRITAWILKQWYILTGMQLPTPPEDGANKERKMFVDYDPGLRAYQQMTNKTIFDAMRKSETNPQPGAEMPRYQCHKKVWALKIKEIHFDSDAAKEDGNRETDETAIIVPVDQGYGAFRVDADYVKKHSPQVGGYYIVYDDGYKSWSPANSFEEGYTKI
jgi:hypothetical protein